MDEPYIDPFEDNKEFRADCFAFYDDFSVKAYFLLREKYPTYHIPMKRVADFDLIFRWETEFEHFGVDSRDIAGTLDGNPECIDRVCVCLLKAMETGHLLEAQGESHLASRSLSPKDSAVLAYAIACFETFDLHDCYQPISSLNFLLQQLVLRGTPQIVTEGRSINRKFDVLSVASTCLERDGDVPSMRTVAGLMGVTPSTISRMFKDHDDYQKEVINVHGTMQSLKQDR